MKSLVKNNILKNYEFFFILYFTSIYIVSPLAGLIRYYVGNTNSLDVLLFYILLLVIFINSSATFFRRLKGWQIILMISIIFSILVSSLFGGGDDTHFIVLKNFLLDCCPIIIFAGCVRDYDKAYKYLVLLMRIFPYLGFFLFYYLRIGGIGDEENYSSELTYRYLLPAVVLLYDMTKRFSIWSLVPFIISTFMVIGAGSRGPLVSIALSGLLFIVFKGGSFRKRLRVIIPAVLVVVAMVFYASRLTDNMFGLVTRFEMSTRTLDAITNEGLLSDDARSSISSIGIQRIIENPFIGTGLVNDRIYIKKAISSSEPPHGWYVHNFFIEVLMQFGFVLGLVVLFFFFRFLINSYTSATSANTEGAVAMLLVLFGAYFIPLLFSGSYLESSGFFALVAIAGSILTRRQTSSQNAIIDVK